MEYLVRKITGRFKELDEKTLCRIRIELKMLLNSWGAVGPDDLGAPTDGGLPLWAEVEFLDNIVQFELECNPFLHSEIMN